MKTMLTFVLLCCSITLFAQKGSTDTTGADNSENAGMLQEMSQNACTCISKIKIKNKAQDEISKSISACIEKESQSYAMMMQLMGSLKAGQKSDTIYLNDGKKHDKYYFAVENWLMDSCSSLSTIAAANNKESASSMSSDKTAKKYYQKGQLAVQNENFEDAADYFQKAVDADDQFAFAWDNLGISLRHLKRYKEAIYAYKKSLAIDPKNLTPLQNLPVVYGYMNQYDSAVACFQNILKIYPQNPEAFYGIANVYLLDKKDFESALQNMCKAYNIYIKLASPYRSDAEKMINYIHDEMKSKGNEEIFYGILKENNIKESN